MPVQPAPCSGPLLYAADNLSLYHAREQPGNGQEHSHDDIQIALPLSGAIDASWQTADGTQRRQAAPPGSLLVTASQQPHTVGMRRETEIAVVWLPASVLAQTATDLMPSGTAELRDVVVVHDGLLRHLCLGLLAELRQPLPPSHLYLDSAATLLAAHLIRNHSADGNAMQEQGGLSPRTLRRVTDFIRGHFDRDISLADLAEIAALSESRFGALFRQSTGFSPYQYLLVQRLEHAKSLLCAGTLSVGEIALLVGFCDQSQFTRQFKKHVGHTPRAFARAVQR